MESENLILYFKKEKNREREREKNEGFFQQGTHYIQRNCSAHTHTHTHAQAQSTHSQTI